MKKILLATLFGLLTMLGWSNTFITEAEGNEKGVVIFDAKSDYHIVETSRFYVLVEWYSGPDFSKGDVIYGDLHSYNFKMVRVNNNTKETKVYIENYWTSKERCMEWLREHNKL